MLVDGNTADIKNEKPAENSEELASLFKDQANSLFKEKKYDEAIALYTKALDCSPNKTYYGNRAAAYLENGDFKMAFQDCIQALKVCGVVFHASLIPLLQRHIFELQSVKYT